MSKKILHEVDGMENTEDGGFNTGKLWKLKKKLCPKPTDPPSAMQRSDGKIITIDEDILEEAVNHYQNVFKERQMEPDLEHTRN